MNGILINKVVHVNKEIGMKMLPKRPMAHPMRLTLGAQPLSSKGRQIDSSTPGA